MLLNYLKSFTHFLFITWYPGFLPGFLVCFGFFPKVRWADLEEQKDADRKRAIGFVVGQTDWEKITDESGQLAQRALNRTKYF